MAGTVYLNQKEADSETAARALNQLCDKSERCTDLQTSHLLEAIIIKNIHREQLLLSGCLRGADIKTLFL